MDMVSFRLSRKRTIQIVTSTKFKSQHLWWFWGYVSTCVMGTSVLISSLCCIKACRNMLLFYNKRLGQKGFDLLHSIVSDVFKQCPICFGIGVVVIPLIDWYLFLMPYSLRDLRSWTFSVMVLSLTLHTEISLFLQILYYQRLWNTQILWMSTLSAHAESLSCIVCERPSLLRVLLSFA